MADVSSEHLGAASEILSGTLSLADGDYIVSLCREHGVFTYICQGTVG